MKINSKYIPNTSLFISAMIAVLFFLNIACSTDETQTVTTLNTLVWEDNFDRVSATDSLPDTTKWTYNEGTGDNGWGNNELQYYTARPENVVLNTEGMLEITAVKEFYMGANYTSGRILTKGLYENAYGRYEARIKLPWGQGIWPAFWLLGDNSSGAGWPSIGEIDIMEYRGQEPTIVHGSVHGPGYSGGEAITKSFNLLNDRFDTDFHVFGIEWGPEYINYYVDDVLYNQITPADVSGEWVFNSNKFYIIMNVAVGGSFAGNPNNETVFPQTMLVDYVRVYQ
ncbi:glycoside hydrolase family 16 protein [Polaribacter sp. HL-MS24]|uniref:glycoside hydrolase family 16 protein n=1 Tax=Polaribacter sp. HL-MS24 TaxID=3077735 RepID=UPI002934AB6E|nr:glycoside hydrolase family 16 protein [Polaribacter sp. HL-MS24]WOC40410.1 glycoside hydrolase family 16 protein [Polaribacter sp. HL-MS24]